MEEKNKKLNFFTRLKYSVFKIENYSTFLGERLSVAIRYFLLLMLIVTIVVAIAQTIIFAKMLNKGYNYFANELPDFKYQDSKLQFSKNVEAYDAEYDFYLFVNTDENITEDKIKEYKNKVYDSTNGIIILNNKMTYVIPGSETEYEFKDIASEYGIESIDKETLLNEYDEYGNTSIIIVYFVISAFGMYIANIITVAMDVLVLTLFGIIATRICGIRITMSPMSKISLHAITLPVLITGIYTSVYLLTGFVIQYYNLMYLLIAYVYIVAAIMVLKTDLIKQQEELIKIEEVRKEVKKELEDEELERKDKKEKEEKQKKENEEKEKDKDTGIDAEPDGSEI